MDGFAVCRTYVPPGDLPDHHINQRATVGPRTNVIRGAEAGADDYDVTKPVGSRDELAARVRALLRGARPGPSRRLPASGDSGSTRNRGRVATRTRE